MSLNTGLFFAYNGIRNAGEQIQVTSQNISNADQAGYSRRTVTTTSVTTNAGTIPAENFILSALDRNLLDGLLSDTTSVGQATVINDALGTYAARLGSVTSDFSLSSTLNDLLQNISLLATTPENDAQRTQVIGDANVIAQYLRDTSALIQEQRLQAENQIGQAVQALNSSLTTLEDLNDKIVTATGRNNQALLVGLEDQRAIELERLSGLVDISYFYNSQNRVQIYQADGQPLLLTNAKEISFDPAANLSGDITFPTGLSPIEVNGVDITTGIRGGELGGLIDLRDNIFVEEQEKFNEFANQLSDTLNAVLNTGAARPSRNELVGDIGFAVADTFSASGSVRIAITDNDGFVQNFSDIDLTTIGTVGGVIGALNGVAGVSASLSVDGELIVTSTDPNLGVSINELSSLVGPDSKGFSDHFGLNDFFRLDSAENIRVAEYLNENNQFFAIGQLSADSALIAGERGITLGDTSVAASLVSALNSNMSFASAGNFAAQSSSLTGYAEAIIGDAALRTSLAQTNFDTTNAVFQETSDFVRNQKGVNIDEETARLIELESYFQASARVVSVIRDLFQELVNTVR